MTTKNGLFLALLLALFTACNDDYTIVEPAGLGVYFIDNQSSKTLIYKGDVDIIIAPTEVKKIGEYADFGTQALPAEGLEQLILYREDNGTQIIALQQDTIINTQWTAAQQDNKEYGVTHYTLTVTDVMIR